MDSSQRRSVTVSAFLQRLQILYLCSIPAEMTAGSSMTAVETWCGGQEADMMESLPRGKAKAARARGANHRI